MQSTVGIKAILAKKRSLNFQTAYSVVSIFAIADFTRAKFS
jgi:hypothetical protein